MTAHWINPETLPREFAALTCKRIKGSHTYDVLAREMHEVLVKFGIQNKMSGITTDNSSNFVKAFR